MDLAYLKDKHTTVTQQLLTLQQNLEQGRGYLKCLADLIALAETDEVPAEEEVQDVAG